MLAVETDEQDDSLPFLVRALLDEQQQLTAVERFAQSHVDAPRPAGEKYYHDLLPLSTPRQGEQYAFDVDLDACSGCKACVAACHALNGLEEDELWRGVGMLVGGTTEAPVIQHVTTACHHCIEPACLNGCPVLAYEKDPTTGIVRHLDDQCIGCQYCMLKCPYDVPKYSASKGIVRKCDMCHDRLSVGEAPACVQSCPNRAIRIRIVSQDAIVEETESNQFLPGVPEPGYTVPTTTYRARRSLPRNLLPADYLSAHAGHGHLALVFMLVLTQMSVGAFVVDQGLIARATALGDDFTGVVRPLHLGAALLLGLFGLASSVFHLGRPRYAFRALLGLRRSWLSREILAFGLFAGAAALYVSAACLTHWGYAASPVLVARLGAFASLVGVSAVACSVMIYVDTRRPFWSIGPTSTKFLLTAAILGAPVALLVQLLAPYLDDATNLGGALPEEGRTLYRLVIAAAVAKLFVESLVFVHLRRRQHTPLKRTALLMTGPLSMTTLKRVFFGVVGGIVLPAMLLAEYSLAEEGFHPLFTLIATLLMLALLTCGELLERYLFFAASVAPKMPGAPAT